MRNVRPYKYSRPWSNTNQYESTRVNTNQHKSDKSQQESTRVNTNQHKSERVNTSQSDQEIIIIYRSLVSKVW